MSERKLAIWRDDYEWYIAYDAEDARELQAEIIGDDDVSPLEEWRLETRDPLTIANDGPNGEPTTRTQAEWIANDGRGILCSTEW